MKNVYAEVKGILTVPPVGCNRAIFSQTLSSLAAVQPVPFNSFDKWLTTAFPDPSDRERAYSKIIDSVNAAAFALAGKAFQVFDYTPADSADALMYAANTILAYSLFEDKMGQPVALSEPTLKYIADYQTVYDSATGLLGIIMDVLNNKLVARPAEGVYMVADGVVGILKGLQEVLQKALLDPLTSTLKKVYTPVFGDKGLATPYIWEAFPKLMSNMFFGGRGLFTILAVNYFSVFMIWAASTVLIVVMNKVWFHFFTVAEPVDVSIVSIKGGKSVGKSGGSGGGLNAAILQEEGTPMYEARVMSGTPVLSPDNNSFLNMENDISLGASLNLQDNTD